MSICDQQSESIKKTDEYLFDKINIKEIAMRQHVCRLALHTVYSRFKINKKRGNLPVEKATDKEALY